MLNDPIVTRKRRMITVLAATVGAVAIVAYLLFPTNPVIAVSVLAISPLLICPIACGAVGLVIFFGSYFSRK